MALEKITIVTDSGGRAAAVAPVVISASRSTDIPAFYAEWFFHRLSQGYCAWYNPFNQQKVYVSFARCKVIVFWTKNPAPILPYLCELDRRGIHYYFQVTLNDYVAEGFEPNVPSVAERINTFKTLSEQVGAERVIWRFDPLIVTPTLTPRTLLLRLWHIGNELKGYTRKLVFSFVDVKAYRKVQSNLVRETTSFTRDDVLTAEMNAAQRQEIIDGLVKLRDIWREQGWDIALATCAEAFDYEAYGIEHNRCIDGALMEQLWSDDEELVYYLRTGKQPTRDLFGTMPPLPPTRKDLKDKGQRTICGCMVSKDIGMYNTCQHLCVYCYANSSRDAVLRNATKHNSNNESIIE